MVMYLLYRVVSNSASIYGVLMSDAIMEPTRVWRMITAMGRVYTRRLMKRSVYLSICLLPWICTCYK